ncbi:hypothetical protein M9458_006316, partial [Cirrhinus mrigala]
MRLRMPSLRVKRQPSLPKDHFEGVVVDYLQPSHEEVALKDLQIDPGLDSADPLHMQLLIPTHTALRPARACHSRESVRSLRRASSLHDIDGMRD